jgi:hypothetical protein
MASSLQLSERLWRVCITTPTVRAKQASIRTKTFALFLVDVLGFHGLQLLLAMSTL